jgi:predicted glycogen debranching enzyme
VFKSFDAGGMSIEGLIAREWLATNGIGGFASSTVPCCNTRKYHGLLVAAMAAPVRRMVLLSRMEETVHCDGWPHALSTNEYPGTFHPEGYRALRAFSPEPFPRWAFQGENWTLQKELCLLREQNTVVLTYTLLAGRRPVALELRPLLALRPIHELGLQWNGKLVTETRAGGTSHHVPATTRTPEVFFAHNGEFQAEPNWYLNTIYRREQERGYSGLEDVWSPGALKFTLKAGQSAHFVCSADPFEFDVALEQAHAQGATTSRCGALESVYASANPSPGAQDDRTLAVLSYAASQFLVHSSAANASAPDAMPCAVIGAYPWSPPSGRAALAGFAGLFLVTGRHAEGRSLLLSMAAKLDRGLMPSDFQENGSAPLYLGADVALWFVNAAYAYFRYTNDEATVGGPLFDTVLRIIEQYRRGTRLGVSVDDAGLLRTHAPAAATTWMDAKVGDWVITPRQGRPVEINALWYNAVSIAAELATRFGRTTAADDLSALSRLIKIAFNDRFWHAAAGCCHDVVSDRGPDPAIRPNQLLAMSLPFPVLSIDRHSTALETILQELKTPLGVRTLSPRDPGYVGRYAGNVVARDRAAHGGSAYPWLLGLLVTAYVRVHGRGDGARREASELLQGCIDHLCGDGLGQLPELFDGDPPHNRGGAMASALSVAEVLRAYYEDVLDRAPAPVPATAADGTVTTPTIAPSIASPPSPAS